MTYKNGTYNHPNYILLVYAVLFLFLGIIPLTLYANSRSLSVDLTKLDCTKTTDRIHANFQVVDSKTRVNGTITSSKKFTGEIIVDGQSPLASSGEKICLLSGVTTKGELLSGIYFTKNGNNILQLTTKSKRNNRINPLVTLKTEQVSKGILTYKQFKVSSAPKSFLANKECNGRSMLSAEDGTQNTSSDSSATTGQINQSVANSSTYSVIVGAEGDSLFAKKVVNPAEEIIRLINEVNEVYQAQLSMKLIPGQIKIYTSQSTDPYFGVGNSDTLIVRFKDSSSVRGAGVYHLITANNLGVSDLGIAYTSSACGSFSYGLSKYSGGNLQRLIMAHEIGHNFGAEHDPYSAISIMTDKVDRRETNLLGNPQFSTRSKNEINSYLSKKAPSNQACFFAEGNTVPPTIVPRDNISPNPTIPVLKRVPSVRVSISLTKKGALTVKTSTSKIASQCKTSVYTGLNKTTVISPENLVTIFALNQKRTKSVSTFNHKLSTPVFIQHETVCTGLPKKVSSVRRVRVDRVIGNVVDIKKWKNELKKSLSSTPYN